MIDELAEGVLLFHDVANVTYPLSAPSGNNYIIERKYESDLSELQLVSYAT